VNDQPPITPIPPRRRLTSEQIAALIQMIIAAALIVSLAVCGWWFWQAADRLGGVGRFIYLPIAMGVFLLLALYRFIQALRTFRRTSLRRRAEEASSGS
jgi:uncharacterized membrane protein